LHYKLLLATSNQDKIIEYKKLFSNLPCELVTMAEQGIYTDVEETGKTFEENATLKAVALAQESKLLTLADDSGLEVSALGGEPGVMSARYAGEGASDKDKVNYLLEKLKGVAWEKRIARFRTVIAIAFPDGKVELCSGECKGFIALEPVGEEGFGYDPVFYLPDIDKTMAELSMAEKNRISHRGNAARKAYHLLKEIFAK